MDTPATLRKCPAFSPLNAEARQSTTSVGSISSPRAWPPPRTDNGSCFIGMEGSIDPERNCRIPRISPPPPPPPPAFCTEAKVAKGGHYGTTFLYTTVLHFCTVASFLETLPEMQWHGFHTLWKRLFSSHILHVLIWDPGRFELWLK